MTTTCKNFFLRLHCALAFCMTLAGWQIYAENIQAFDPPDRHISVRQTTPGNWSGSGFFPVKIEINNNEGKTSTWEIAHGSAVIGRLSVDPGGSQGGLFYLTPGQEGRLTITEKSGRLTHHFYIRKAGYTRNLIVFSPGTSTDLRKKIDDKTHSSDTSSWINPMDWPADHRVYSSYSYAVFTQSDYDQMDAARKTALHLWVKSGGNLGILTIEPESGKNAAKKEQKLGWGSIGFYTAPDEEKAATSLAKMVNSKHLINNSYPSLPKSAVDAVELKPSGFVVVLLIVFAIVIGPLCLFVLAPAKKRHRLFILIPGISLGFSLLLFLLILLVDGTGGKGTRLAQIYLDPDTHMAIIKQQQVCKTGILLNSTFELDETIEFYSDNDNNERSKYRYGRKLGGGWFSSRSSLNQKLLSFVPSRARITLINGEEGDPVIQSTFPGILREFYYLDEQGVCWTVQALSSGNNAQEDGLVHPGKKIALAKLEGSRRPSGMRKGTFQAKTADHALAPVDTLDSILWQDEDTIVFGPLAKTP